MRLRKYRRTSGVFSRADGGGSVLRFGSVLLSKSPFRRRKRRKGRHRPRRHLVFTSSVAVLFFSASVPFDTGDGGDGGAPGWGNGTCTDRISRSRRCSKAPCQLGGRGSIPFPAPELIVDPEHRYLPKEPISYRSSHGVYQPRPVLPSQASTCRSLLSMAMAGGGRREMGIGDLQTLRGWLAGWLAGRGGRGATFGQRR